jgi:hypothetical protein
MIYTSGLGCTRKSVFENKSTVWPAWVCMLLPLFCFRFTYFTEVQSDGTISKNQVYLFFRIKAQFGLLG